MGVVICVQARVTDNANFISAANNSEPSDNVGLKFAHVRRNRTRSRTWGLTESNGYPVGDTCFLKRKNLRSLKVVF